jgi:SAM-dependent methyltransferase
MGKAISLRRHRSLVGEQNPWLASRKGADAGRAIYDQIGRGYREVRRPHPRIAERIEAALGDAESVLNVGAGTGSYEPLGRRVVAVEPSQQMIEQRPEGSAAVVQASAEPLPFADDSFDAAMAIISIHHWNDLPAELSEMRRVARRRVVILTFDPEPLGDLWLVKDYFPRTLEIHGDAMPAITEFAAMLPGARGGSACAAAVKTASSVRSGIVPRCTSIPTCGGAARCGT